MTIIAKRRAILAGIGLAALAACTPAVKPMRGPQVRKDDDRRPDRPSEGGIGGTGIVGVLHGRGSLLVNGLRIASPADAAVHDAFGRRSLDDLMLGQALSVEAADAGGVLEARAIDVVHPLVGPIETLTDTGFRCLGVAVAIEDGAPLIGPDGAPFSPEPGQRVAVSGLWRGTGVVASRVDLLDRADAPVVVAGDVKPGAVPGAARLGALDLILTQRRGLPPTGSFATAIGRRVGAALIADSLIEGRFQGRAGPLTRLSVEGYLESIASPPGYAISGLGHSVDPDARLAALAPGRALFVGPYDGDFRVAFGMRLPEGIAARRGVLTAIEDGFAPAGARRTR